MLTLSARRCCLCFGINSDYEEKQGQIAHLDKDSSNSNLKNLAFLCLPHHDKYDSKTSQSKNYTIEEAKGYRKSLHTHVAELRKNNSNLSSEIYEFKKLLINENSALFFFAASVSNKPEIRELILNEVVDDDFKEQLINAWFYLDKPVPKDQHEKLNIKEKTRLDHMAEYLFKSPSGKEDLQALLALSGIALSIMPEDQRYEKIFKIHDDTIRSGVLLLSNISRKSSVEPN